MCVTSMSHGHAIKTSSKFKGPTKCSYRNAGGGGYTDQRRSALRRCMFQRYYITTGGKVKFPEKEICKARFRLHMP